MQGFPHLTKRGNVYQWRRRSRRFSTGIFDIKLSLGTTDLRTAHILCRKLSAESDVVMDQIIDQQISTEEARLWLADVARREKDKIERLKFTRRILADDPQSEDLHDEATARVWQFLKKQGLGGSDEQFLADMPTELAPKSELALNIARQELTSTTRHRKITAEFEALTGRRPAHSSDRATLTALYIAGKAAAWEKRSVKPTPTPKATTGTVNISQPVTEVAPLQQDHPSPLLEDIIARMIKLKAAEKVERKSLTHYNSFASLFIKLMKLRDVREIRQSHVTEYRALLSQIPKSWGKSPADQKATRVQVLARAAKLPAGQVGLSISTVNRHLEHLNQIVNQARDEGIPVDPRLHPNKLRRKENGRERDKRQAFTVDDLRKLFQGAVWTGSRSDYYQTDPGPKVYKNGTYWVPLLGAYTGARREELAGLSPADIVVVDDIPSIEITETSLRRIKNAASKRIIPIHSTLIGLGFLEHVERARMKGQTDLFPDLAEKNSNAHGRKLGRKFRMAIDKTLGPSAEGLSFHSLRHYVQTALEEIGDIPDNVRRRIS